MIARIWHGITLEEKADAYMQVLNRTGVPDYEGTPGNRGVTILRRTEAGQTHFLILTLWDSEDAIRAFAGDDIQQAHYYPEDKEYLLEFEPTVSHYTVEYLQGPQLAR